MRAHLVVLCDPRIKVGLQFGDRTVNLFPERNSIELVERALVEALDDAVGLRALGLGARVIDVFDREIEFILVPFRITAILRAAVGVAASLRGSRRTGSRGH